MPEKFVEGITGLAKRSPLRKFKVSRRSLQGQRSTEILACCQVAKGEAKHESHAISMNRVEKLRLRQAVFDM
jgi:hypothetical protein